MAEVTNGKREVKVERRQTPIPKPRTSLLKLVPQHVAIDYEDCDVSKSDDPVEIVTPTKHNAEEKNENTTTQVNEEEDDEDDDIGQLVERRTSPPKSATSRTMSYKAASSNPYMVPNIIGRATRKQRTEIEPPNDNVIAPESESCEPTADVVHLEVPEEPKHVRKTKKKRSPRNSDDPSDETQETHHGVKAKHSPRSSESGEESHREIRRKNSKRAGKARSNASLHVIDDSELVDDSDQQTMTVEQQQVEDDVLTAQARTASNDVDDKSAVAELSSISPTAPMLPAAPPRPKRKSKVLQQEKSANELPETPAVVAREAEPYAVADVQLAVIIPAPISKPTTVRLSPLASPYCVTDILSREVPTSDEFGNSTAATEEENFYSPVEVSNSPTASPNKMKGTVSSDDVLALAQQSPHHNGTMADFRKFASVDALDVPKATRDRRLFSMGTRPLSMIEADGRPPLSTASSEVSEVSGFTVSSTSINSNSDDSDEEVKVNSQVSEDKKKVKALQVAREILTTEKTFCDALKLLNVDFRQALEREKTLMGRALIDQRTIDQLFPYMSQMQRISEEFVRDLKKRVKHWAAMPMLADIFTKKGAFLKLYSCYISEYDAICQLLDELRRKSSDFNNVVKRFEESARCAGLQLKHYMLKPVQRIPQYRLLLTEYKKNLPNDSPDYEKIDEAISVVTKVAEHANQTMKQEDNLQRLLAVQNSLVGQFEAIKPFRQFIRDGILNKIARKEVQQRRFILLSDVLVYATPASSTMFKLKNELSLMGMKVTVPGKEEVPNEFNIISVQRSFTLSARTPEERTEWVNALQTAIDAHLKKRSTFARSTNDSLASTVEGTLGDFAPLWVPDDRVTMCMVCSNEFSFAFRRHHCRACGRVVCAYCSENKWPLRYLKSEPARVCPDCYEALQAIDGPQVAPVGDQSKSPNAIGSFVRGVLRSSLGPGEKRRAAVLKEQASTDDDKPVMNGHCKIWANRKWKKRYLSLRGNVLFVYKASGDTAASESFVLLGYNIVTFSMQFQGVDPNLILELSHKNLPAIILCMDNVSLRDMWRDLCGKAATIL